MHAGIRLGSLGTILVVLFQVLWNTVVLAGLSVLTVVEVWYSWQEKTIGR
jgi:hypothetical protein